MKQIPTPARILGILSLAAAALLLAACTRDDATCGEPDRSDTPVRFRAAMQTLGPASDPGTATAENGQTGWTADARIGLFMVANGGSIPADVIPEAHNIPYAVDPATGALTPADGKSIYYPQGQAVDFVAYHPFDPDIAQQQEDSDPYTIPVPDLRDQTTPEKQAAMDVLLSDNASGIGSSEEPVALRFRHLMTKFRLDITLQPALAGKTVSGAQLLSHVYGVDFRLNGKPANSSIAPERSFISALLLDAPAATGAAASFTALVVPEVWQYDLVMTVDGKEYTGSIPGINYKSNTLYVYPVSVGPEGISVGNPSIRPWTTAPHEPEEADFLPVETVKIKAGTFLMGSPDTDPDAKPNEKPRHWVRLTRDFYMSKYEVTRTQYAEFLNAVGIPKANVDQRVWAEVAGFGEQPLFRVNPWGWTPLWNDATGKWEASGDYPMIYVTWYGAKAYADWAGGRLPTEAEWEYACRAGTTTRYSFGDDAALLDEYAVYFDQQENPQPAAVGSKKPNPWGLYDMHGNVNEWCLDCVGDMGYPSAETEAEAIVDPLGTTGEVFIFRSGNFGNGDVTARSAYRNIAAPDPCEVVFGFRVVFPI